MIGWIALGGTVLVCLCNYYSGYFCGHVMGRKYAYEEMLAFHKQIERQPLESDEVYSHRLAEIKAEVAARKAAAREKLWKLNVLRKVRKAE